VQHLLGWQVKLLLHAYCHFMEHIFSNQFIVLLGSPSSPWAVPLRRPNHCHRHHIAITVNISIAISIAIVVAAPAAYALSSPWSSSLPSPSLLDVVLPVLMDWCGLERIKVRFLSRVLISRLLLILRCM
jgi:hypothetical protein